MKRRKIYLRKVDSRAVYAIGYRKSRSELYIFSRSERRGLYVYSDVRPSEWHMVEHTSTVGGIVNAHIKPRHSYRQLNLNEVEIVIRRESPATHD